MTNPTKAMARVQKIRNRVKKAIADTAPVAMLDRAAMELIQLRVGLQAMAANFAVVATNLKESKAEFQNVRSAFARIEAGNFNALAKVEGVTVDEVEDLDAFAEIVKSITNASTNERRMKMCVNTLTAIREAIERWQSKLDRFERMSVARGNSPSEIATAEVKAESFKCVIKALRDRGEVISQAHDAARKAMMDFLAKDAKAYEPIFNNN